MFGLARNVVEESIESRPDIAWSASPVFGQVGDPGCGIGRHRLVREVSHVGKRRRGPAGKRTEGTDLKYVPMSMASGGGISGVGLFAGVPSAPRCHAAGTVSNVPADARDGRDEQARGQVEHEVGRSSSSQRVVPERRIAKRGENIVRRVMVHLMIPHQNQMARAELLDHRHPVM